MSASIDTHGTKRVLMIVANPGTSPTTGWPVGFWWAEITHPYWTFTEGRVRQGGVICRMA